MPSPMNRFLPAVFALSLLLLPGCGRASASSSGNRTSSGSVSISCGGEIDSTRKPSAIFGTLEQPSGREYTYLILVRGLDEDRASVGSLVEGTTTSLGSGVAESKTDLKFGNQALSVQVLADHDQAAETLSNLRVELFATPLDLGKGRLILLDAKAPPGWHSQVDVTLPDPPVDHADLASRTAEFVDELLATNESVRSFWRD